MQEREEQPEPEDLAHDAKLHWLKEMTTKSWNLELVISGASFVLTTYLPDAVEYLFEYQNQYYQVFGIAKNNVRLPMLAYSFFMVVAYTLIITFTIHLILRAFWVSLIGLQAAYPDGIRYEKLFNVSERMQELYKSQLGTLSGYIFRLDRTCSQVLGVAFSIAFIGVAVGFFYLIVYVVTNLLAYTDNEHFANILYTGLSLFAFGVAIFSLWIKKNKAADEKYGTLMGQISQWMGVIFIPFFYKASQYLTLTVMSNTTAKRYYSWMFVVIGIMSVGLFVVMTRKIESVEGRGIAMSYYLPFKNQNYVHDTYYDAHRAANAPIPSVSIPSDIVTDPFVKVFVHYPPYLEGRMGQFCPLPNLPDSLQGKNKHPLNRKMREENRMYCFGQFFQLAVNDSIYAKPEWVFSEKTGLFKAKGIMAYVPAKALSSGKNTISVKIPSEQRLDSMELYGIVPVWKE
jgi:hypothetical protein